MKVYKSKVAYGFLLLLFVFFVCVFVSIVLRKNTLNAVILSSGVLLLTTLFTLHIFLNTKYIIVGNILKIRSGFIYKKDIDIERIKSISKTKGLISSPAASFDRIELRYDTYGSIIVSPKEKKSFAKELKNINTNIQNNIEK